MMQCETSTRFKLAAIDLDGTLLGPRHAVSEENLRAVRRLQESGAQVVLASGRHYNSMRKYADALPGVEWIVSCQGGELSDLRRTSILSRQFLPEAEVAKVMGAGRSSGFTTVAYTADGIFTDSGWDYELEFYSDLSGHRPVEIHRDELSGQGVFKVIWMGTPEAISEATTSGAGSTVQTVRTHARFLEFMPAEVSKGFALEKLAQRLGIEATDAVVFGDGENDIPMFEWAGLSVAMPHGWSLALQSAKLVAPDGPVETALARAIDLVLPPN
jgi:Cof subfamily protein (haloacid dehalogenase superfamily)